MHTLTARTYHDHSHTTPFAQITLDYDTRFCAAKCWKPTTASRS